MLSYVLFGGWVWPEWVKPGVGEVVLLVVGISEADAILCHRLSPAYMND